MGKYLKIKSADFSTYKIAQTSISAISGGSSSGGSSTTTNVTISVVASPTGGGTVSGGGSYAQGTQITITATAKSGYTFSQWSDGNTNASRTITVGSSSTTYTATFVASGESSEEESVITYAADYDTWNSACTVELGASGAAKDCKLYANKFTNQLSTINGVKVKTGNSGVAVRVYKYDASANTLTLLGSGNSNNGIVDISFSDTPMNASDLVFIDPTAGVIMKYGESAMTGVSESEVIQLSEVTGGTSPIDVSSLTVEAGNLTIGILPYYKS